MKVLGDAGSMIRDLKTNGGFHLSGLFKNNICKYLGLKKVVQAAYFSS
jgi:hypothetical protein